MNNFLSLVLSWNLAFGMLQRQLLMLKVDLNFKKLWDTMKHPELALDHSKAHLFLVGTLTSIDDVFLTWSLRLMKMHIRLNLCSSNCWKMASLGKHCWQRLPLWSHSFRCYIWHTALPSPSNLKCCRMITESSCVLCRESICTSAHILGACKIALHQVCFSFRHDNVLCELAVTLNIFISSYKPNKSSDINFINFAREEKKSKTAPRKDFFDYTQLLTGI